MRKGGWLGLVWLVQVATAIGQESWPQWGGIHRNFVVDASGLADSWPESGPPVVWSRPLGEGHSAIAFNEGRLFTQYRPRLDEPNRWHEEEIVIALDAATAETLWEYRYPSHPLDFQFGAGPHATPLVVGELVYAAGTNKQIHALDKKTGELVWAHDLVEEYGAPPTLLRPAVKAGYGSSPLAYGETVIVTAGGKGQAVMAFHQRDGSLVWKSQDFNIAPASPILIELDGRQHLVVFGGFDVHGLDPKTGELLWSHAHPTRGDMNISTPVWGEDRLLFLSSAYDGGSRMIELIPEDGRTRTRELWFTRKLRVHIGTVLRIGDYLYGSSGDFGPTFITAVHARTGEVAWQDRRFARSTFLRAGDKLILMDEDGTLGLVKVSPSGMEILARAEILTNKAWTVPTLVGTELFVRDRRAIMKLELGSPEG